MVNIILSFLLIANLGLLCIAEALGSSSAKKLLEIFMANFKYIVIAIFVLVGISIFLPILGVLLSRALMFH